MLRPGWRKYVKRAKFRQGGVSLTLLILGPSNKDVIRLAGGVPLLSQCLLYKNDQLIKNIFQCFNVLGKDST